MVDNISSMEENIRATAENNLQLQGQIETYRDSLLNKVQDYHEKKAEMVASVKSGLDDGSSLTPRITEKIHSLSIK